jgi:integrase
LAEPTGGQAAANSAKATVCGVSTVIVAGSDTRVTGGNPLSKAHETACRKAGIEGFRIHDWRHHFAVWFLKNGGNLRALCQMAGWSSMRMVQRYAVYDEQSDLDDLMVKTA